MAIVVLAVHIAVDAVDAAIVRARSALYGSIAKADVQLHGAADLAVFCVAPTNFNRKRMKTRQRYHQ